MRLGALCARAGLDMDRVSPAILSRMQLLAETTKTMSDCERCADLAEKIFRYVAAAKPLDCFTERERNTVLLGSLFSDIGKTGPAEADLDGQQLVAEMFAVESVLDSTMTVARFFDTYFPADAQQRVPRFCALGLDAGMSMREFWNLHTTWTLHILRGDGVPPEAVAAAATHHLLENVNPDAIVAEDGSLSEDLGAHARFDRAEKLVILLDKYDATRRRGRFTHAEAIRWLGELIEKNGRFRGDPCFLSLIEALDYVIEPSRLREETGTRQAFSPREASVRVRSGTESLTDTNHHRSGSHRG